MKALTISQPYASLIADQLGNQAKDYGIGARA
jgi:hypothetical protein